MFEELHSDTYYGENQFWYIDAAVTVLGLFFP